MIVAAVELMSCNAISYFRVVKSSGAKVIRVVGQRKRRLHSRTMLYILLRASTQEGPSRISIGKLEPRTQKTLKRTPIAAELPLLEPDI